MGIFINLSKTFDTANHHILISKLKNYGVKGKNFKSWFKSYLENHKQYLNNYNDVTNLAHIKRRAQQGSIFESLLFLIYVNNPYNASNILDPIMFADDTNLLFI